MASKRLRISSLLVLLGSALALTGLVAPGASAAPGDYHVTFEQQPSDAAIGELITGAAFDPTGGETGFVQVKVMQEQFEGPPMPVEDAEVTFVLPEDAPSSDLHVLPRLTDAGGIATFAPEFDPETESFDNPLWIGTANQPFTTDYELIPVVTPPPEPVITIASETAVTGSASNGFDIWEDGCSGEGCQVTLTPGLNSLDTYATSEDVGMGASSIGTGGTNITCPTQRVIFSSDLFFHATSGTGPVFLMSHITREDMKAATNNGQKHVGWCVGLKNDPGPWNFSQQDTNGSGEIDLQDLYVGMAPKCPRKNAMNFAPCIVSRMGDDNGGSFISGWLPGGDPPRRT